MELAQLNVTDDNKAIVDAYMGQLEELNKEYDRLNADLKKQKWTITIFNLWLITFSLDWLLNKLKRN